MLSPKFLSQFLSCVCLAWNLLNCYTFNWFLSELFDKSVLYIALGFIPFLQWVTFLDLEGHITDSDALKKRIFYGGVDHISRKEVCTCFLESYLVLLNWLSILFSVLIVKNVGLAVLVGILCIWFNICGEGISSFNKKVRVWDSKKSVAGLQ